MGQREILAGSVLDLQRRDGTALREQAATIRASIYRLLPKAETGEQWAEICRLEAEAVRLEQDAVASESNATALRVKDERDEALKLLRRTLELREIGNEGAHKTDIRAFLARLGEPVAISRFARQQALERAIVAFNPDAREAIELVHVLQRALQDRFEAKASDVDDLLGQACSALEELE